MSISEAVWPFGISMEADASTIAAQHSVCSHPFNPCLPLCLSHSLLLFHPFLTLLHFVSQHIYPFPSTAHPLSRGLNPSLYSLGFELTHEYSDEYGAMHNQWADKSERSCLSLLSRMQRTWHHITGTSAVSVRLINLTEMWCGILQLKWAIFEKIQYVWCIFIMLIAQYLQSTNDLFSVKQL